MSTIEMVLCFSGLLYTLVCSVSSVWTMNESYILTRSKCPAAFSPRLFGSIDSDGIDFTWIRFFEPSNIRWATHITNYPQWFFNSCPFYEGVNKNLVDWENNCHFLNKGWAQLPSYISTACRQKMPGSLHRSSSLQSIIARLCCSLYELALSRWSKFKLLLLAQNDLMGAEIFNTIAWFGSNLNQ